MTSLARDLALALPLLALCAPAAAQGGLAHQLAPPGGPRQTAPEPSHDVSADAPSLDEPVPEPPGTAPHVGLVPRPPSYGQASPAVGGTLLDDRLRVLDSTWAVLGARGPNYTNSVLSLILGTAQVVLGGVMLEIGAPWDRFAPVFMVTGGVQVVRTIVVDFILRPNPQPIAMQFVGMPSRTVEQRQARLEYGERQLESLAEQSAVLRYVDSGINLAGAAVLVGTYFAVRPDVEFDPIELIFFVGPAVSTVISLINMFSPSAAEQRWSAYRRMTERMGEDRVQLTPTLQIDPRGGATGGLHGAF